MARLAFRREYVRGAPQRLCAGSFSHRQRLPHPVDHNELRALINEFTRSSAGRADRESSMSKSRSRIQRNYKGFYRLTNQSDYDRAPGPVSEDSGSGRTIVRKGIAAAGSLKLRCSLHRTSLMPTRERRTPLGPLCSHTPNKRENGPR